MSAKNPRVYVSFNEDDLEIFETIAKQKKISMSALIRKVMEDWLEEYEDYILAQRAEKIEQEWIEKGCHTISHEELCRKLGLE